MSTTKSPAPVPVPMTCIACKEEIKANAKICHYCDTPQDWRRYLNFSNTFLSLIIALLSVAALTLPELKAVFFKPKTDIALRIVDIDNVQGHFGEITTADAVPQASTMRCDLVLILTNSGEKPGSIKLQGIMCQSEDGIIALGEGAMTAGNSGSSIVTIKPNAYLSVVVHCRLGLWKWTPIQRQGVSKQDFLRDIEFNNLMLKGVILENKTTLSYTVYNSDNSAKSYWSTFKHVSQKVKKSS
jgi:hypothetical protein